MEAETKSTVVIHDKQNSIKITKMSKGYNWEVKRYFNAGEETSVFEEIKEIETALKKEYGEEE